MSVRIQRRRIRGWRMPPHTVYVGRPTVFGNPFTVADVIAADPVLTIEAARARCVALFRDWLAGKPVPPFPDADARRQDLMNERHRLIGVDLACWCPTGQPCHADVLIELAAAGVGMGVPT